MEESDTDIAMAFSWHVKGDHYHRTPRSCAPCVNALARMADDYATSVARVRQDLSIAELQLRDHQTSLGKTFEREEYLSKLTNLRDRLESKLSASEVRQPDRENGPTFIFEYRTFISFRLRTWGKGMGDKRRPSLTFSAVRMTADCLQCRRLPAIAVVVEGTRVSPTRLRTAPSGGLAA